MFKQPIAFVIGAGASVEYGLPVGAELLKRISAAVGPGQREPWGDGQLYNAIANLFLQSTGAYEIAATELGTFIASGVSSIDDALTWFSSRQEVIDLGKIAIVNEILKAERGSPLYGRQINSDDDFPNTWIPHLLSMVMDGHKSEDAERAFANVTLINFNYDRTIEHFLHVALQRKFRLDSARARRIVVELNMFRPYGVVGVLPWQAEGGIEFGANLNPQELSAASKNIKTFSEGTTGALQDQIRLSLERARVVVFLGFGFHTQNMELIRVGRAEQWKRAYATTFRIHEANNRDMQRFIGTTVGATDPMPMLLDWSAHTLVTDLRPAIMAAASM
jgi:hypothetical protein